MTGWTKHKAVVEKFWDAISAYFDSIDVSGMKIYQDGTIACSKINLIYTIHAGQRQVIKEER